MAEIVLHQHLMELVHRRQHDRFYFVCPIYYLVFVRERRHGDGYCMRRGPSLLAARGMCSS